jgi:hypothetical protein
MKKEFLREISNDDRTPKRKKSQLNEDGLFLSDDCSSPDHQCTCNSEQIVITEF